MTLPTHSLLERARLMRVADYLAAAVAASLPWSTSATLILAALWLLALIPALTWDDVRRDLATPAGGLPVLLVLLGILGMAWADGSLIERWKGLDSFLKLLVIPLAFAQFRRSERGNCALGAFVISCLVLLLVSYFYALAPDWVGARAHGYGVPVKNASGQSGEFVICIFGLLYLAIDAFERRRWLWLSAIAFATVGMLANILFIATSRTALLTILLLLVLFALKKLSTRGNVVLGAVVVVLAVAAWFASPYLRARVDQAWSDYQRYEATDQVNSAGERIEFYKRSLRFIAEAPIVGHGTGSIPTLFRHANAGKSGAAGRVTANPHNQTFAVGIQLGLVGVVVLWAMWIAHWLLFRGDGVAAWVGLLIVAQNVFGSLLNSHLFDFQQGWTYVLGVGIAGGMALKGRAAAADQPLPAANR
jgi:O-antigen ligase